MFGLELHAGWWWAIGGAILLILEVLAPGFFLMFVGAAAIVTGLVTIALDIPLAAQLVLFVIASAVSVMLGKRYYGEQGLTGDVGMLNDANRRLAGRTATVVEPVDQHGGRVKLADGEWSARGGPAAAGEHVRIVSVDGNCLIVEANTPPAA